MLYILKLACLQWKNRYVIHIKISMFTTEKREKTGMLYILKLLIVCLLLKYGKKRVCCTY